jgi:phenylacetate-CoA ligase
MLREHLWYARDFERTFAAIRVAKQNPAAQRLPGVEVDGWGAETALLDCRGRGALLDLAVPLGDQCAWLARVAPAYFLTYPSNLKALLGHGLAPWPGLVQVKTLGEMVDAELRARCRDQLGVPLVDEYSAQEIGSIAIQCPLHEHYHVQAENARVEVLKDDGSACAAGEIGRVVVTSLAEFRTPLLRYAVGDYAEVGAPCACGRGLPVLARVMGRVRNMIRLPDGGLRWPLPGDGRYRELAPVRQYQFVQTSLTRFEVRLVCERALAADEARALVAWMRERLGHPFEIDLVRVDAIPRHASGKYEDFVCGI